METKTDRPYQIENIAVHRNDLRKILEADAKDKIEEIKKQITAVIEACKPIAEKRFVIMENKCVWFDRKHALLYPKFDKVEMPCIRQYKDGDPCFLSDSVTGWNKKRPIDKCRFFIDSFEFQVAKFLDVREAFGLAENPYYDENNGHIKFICRDNVNINKAYFACDDSWESRNIHYHRTGGDNWGSSTENSSNYILLMIVHYIKLNGETKKSFTPEESILAWIQNGLIPEGLSKNIKSDYEVLMTNYSVLSKYLSIKLDNISKVFHSDQFYEDVVSNKMKETVYKYSFDLEANLQAVMSGSKPFTYSMASLRQMYLDCDKKRAALSSYENTVITDINKGHWELAEELLTGEDYLTIPVPKDEVWTARPPQIDVVLNGSCAIDFGTKSTVVVCRRGTDARLLRVGADNISKAAKPSDYENPTVIELRDLSAFREAYDARAGRPYTEWEQVTVSHQAADALLQQDVAPSVYYAVFSELKQWAHEKDRRLNLKDRQGHKWKLNPYLELSEGEFDPIELYAYYLGLYINNMHQGIYLDYIMSFPVNYDKAVREKLRTSFERGLKKALPPMLLNDEEAMSRFRVYAGASEPAAYAVSALQAYGLEPQKEGDITGYGVFDFGGGTTDFDFGIEKMPKNRRKAKFELHQFGNGGDPYLGGENLLNILAYQVFIDNLDIMRQNQIAIALPHGEHPLAGTELLVFPEKKASQNAFMNRKLIAENLRPLWEHWDNYQEKYSNPLDLSLFSSNKDQSKNHPSVKLKVNVDALENRICEAIDRGVTNFFDAYASAFSGRDEMPYPIHIFLAGNSCKSHIVKECFDAHIKEVEADMTKELGKDASGTFQLHMPLGMKEVAEKTGKLEGAQLADQKALMGDETDDAQAGAQVSLLELDKQLTGKTGVAFGLLRSRKGGKDVKIINENMDTTGESPFPYFLGDIDDKNHFYVRIGKGINYQIWAPFCYADEEDFEIYYTAEPTAVNNQLPPEAVSMVNCRIKVEDTSDDDDVMIYIRKTAPDKIEFAVGREADFATEAGFKDKNIYKQSLS